MDLASKKRLLLREVSSPHLTFVDCQNLPLDGIAAAVSCFGSASLAARDEEKKFN